MADRASASIIIGGTIPEALIPDLLNAIETNDGRSDWGGEPVTRADIEDGATLTVYADDLAGGIFDTLEATCEAHGIAFVRDSASCGGAFGPERVIFTGAGSSHAYDMTECGDIALTHTAFRGMASLDEISAWFAAATFSPPPVHILADSDGAPRSEISHGR